MVVAECRRLVGATYHAGRGDAVTAATKGRGSTGIPLPSTLVCWAANPHPPLSATVHFPASFFPPACESQPRNMMGSSQARQPDGHRTAQVNGYFKKYGGCYDLCAHPRVTQLARCGTP